METTQIDRHNRPAALNRVFDQLFVRQKIDPKSRKTAFDRRGMAGRPISKGMLLLDGAMRAGMITGRQLIPLNFMVMLDIVKRG